MQAFLNRSLNRRNVVRGFLFFLFCTVVGLYISFLWSGTQDIGLVLRSMRGKFLLLAVLCMFSDWLCGAARFHIFVRKMAPGLTFLDSLRANLATLCAGGITPFQTGGFGHMYIYNRVGVPLSGCITTGIISFIGTLVFLLLFAGYIIWQSPNFLPKGITFISRYSLLMFVIFLSFFLLMAFRPGIFLRPLTRLRLPKRRGLHAISKLLDRLISNLDRLITEHKAFTQMFISNHKGICILNFVLTAGIYTSRFVGGYLVARALNGEVLFEDVVAAQAILHFVILFAPSPGASGIAEFLTVALMRNLISSNSLGLFSLLTRFFTSYCAVAIGGVVLLSQLAKDLDWRTN